MRIRTLFALLSLGALAACGSDDPTALVEDTGATADADTGASDADTADPDTGETCDSGFECLRLSDCAGAGLTSPSCVTGCCVEGTPVDPPDPVEECGDITFQGECEGTVVRWCQDGALSEIDCAEFFQQGQTGSCELFTDDFGYFCAAQAGEICLSEGNPLLCAGDGPAGCSINDLTVADGSACVAFEADCVSPEDPATFTDYCEGELAVIGCNVDQPIAYNCAAFTGSCTDGACVNIEPGGPCFDDGPACAPGLTCEGATDTSLGTCTGELADPTCDDGVQNGDEEGVDCGGACDACEVEPTCDDGVENGDEEGVDCGGSCDPCEGGPTCDDAEQNGDESDVDCGGGTCDACADGGTCGVADDCASGVCGEEDGLCAAPACDDGVENGDEGGIDCDGSCDPCEM